MLGFEIFQPLGFHNGDAAEVKAHANDTLRLTDAPNCNEMLEYLDAHRCSKITFINVRRGRIFVLDCTFSHWGNDEITCIVNLNKEKAVRFHPDEYDEDEAIRKVLE